MGRDIEGLWMSWALEKVALFRRVENHLNMLDVALSRMDDYLLVPPIWVKGC